MLQNKISTANKSWDGEIYSCEQVQKFDCGSKVPHEDIPSAFSKIEERVYIHKSYKRFNSNIQIMQNRFYAQNYIGSYL